MAEEGDQVGGLGGEGRIERHLAAAPFVDDRYGGAATETAAADRLDNGGLFDACAPLDVAVGEGADVAERDLAGDAHFAAKAAVGNAGG